MMQGNADILIDRVARSAEKHADRPALVIGGKEYTYRELMQQARMISSAITVAIPYPRSQS